MKAKLLWYIDYCLKQARLVPNLVDVWEHQAFGALTLYGMSVYEADPDAEAEMNKRWNEDFTLRFQEIRENSY